jgi:fumarate reductase subunit D
MKHLLLKLEPIIWLLFGAGLSIGTMLLTGYVIVVGLAIPMGLVDPSALAYPRAHALASSWLGRLVVLGLIALPLWKGAHHIRSLSVDFNGGDRDGAVGGLLYLAAGICSVLGIIAVAQL